MKTGPQDLLDLLSFVARIVSILSAANLQILCPPSVANEQIWILDTSPPGFKLGLN